MQRLWPIIASCLVLSACGGGGGGGGGSSSSPTPVVSRILYVRASGSDKNTGASPDHALGTVARAGQIVKPGGTVYVGAGHYVGRVDLDVHGTGSQPVNLIADSSGEQTGDAGDVILDAGGDIFALRLTTATDVTVDGFTITGAAPTGNTSATQIEIRSASTGSAIKNCVVTNGDTADGIRIQDSAGVELFNNLIANNNRGILISGASRNATLINNTIVDNTNTGITIKETGSDAPSGATLLNNIVQDSGNNVNISVSDGPPSSLRGYSGDFNLVFLSSTGDQSKGYRPTTIRGDNDINQDAGFAHPSRGDYSLGSKSPAIDAGTNAIDPDLLDELLARSADTNGDPDTAPADLGYHAPIAQ